MSLGAGRPVSAEDLARAMGLSRPSLSRWLEEAAEDSLILLEYRDRKIFVTPSSRGYDVLRSALLAVSKIGRGRVVPARVFSGMGEGAYYLRLQGYLTQLENLLGYRPFPGTLNLRLLSFSDIEAVRLWREMVTPLRVSPFREGGRLFGGASIYPVILMGEVEAHAIFPDRRHYGDDVMEVVWRENLRSRLSLSDGSIIAVTLADWDLVGRGGLEPPTSASSRRRHSR